MTTAVDLAHSIAQRRTSAVEQVRAAIDRIEADDPPVNAVVVRDFERALDAAHAADRQIAEGRSAPLLGVPITVKESFDVAGLPTTFGYEEFADNIATTDSQVVARLRAAGAIVVGKTNVPTNLVDIQSINPVYGRTNNPADLTRTCGGSSGGSAAAVAAGFVPLEYGSDIGGSIRVPAHFCGVWGLKTTYGVVSTDGHALPQPPGQDRAPKALSVVGPLGANAQDLALALTLTSDLPLPPATSRLSGSRLLMLTGYPSSSIDSEVAAGLERAAAAAERAGAIVDRLGADGVLIPGGAEVPEVRVPDLTAHHGDYMRMLGWTSSRGVPAGGAPRPSLVDWFEICDVQARATRAWHRLFEAYAGVLAAPIGMPAFEHDERPLMDRTLTIDGVSRPFVEQFAWPGLATFPGLPSVCFPAGRSASGLPTGVQLIGRPFADRDVLGLAGQISEEMSAA